MAINTSGKNAMLDALGTLCTYMALYTDDTATTEVTGGTYARQSVTWSAASNGSKAISNSPAFNIPSGTTVKSIGLLTASTGGTQHAFYNANDEAYTGDGTYTVTSGSISLT